MSEEVDTNFQFIRVVDIDAKGKESVGYHTIPKTFLNPAGVETKYPWPASDEYFQVFAASEEEVRKNAPALFGGAPLDERKAAALALLATLEAEEAESKKTGK